MKGLTKTLSGRRHPGCLIGEGGDESGAVRANTTLEYRLL